MRTVGSGVSSAARSLRHQCTRILASRAFPVASGLVAVALMLGIGVNLLRRAGQWPPVLVASPPAVVITGPGVVASTTEVQVAVLGAVEHPGIYSLQEGARVRDAVAAAGGMVLTADATRVTMDMLVSDGGFVYVPHGGEVLPPLVDGRIRLNVATAAQLHDALGMSLVIARRIVAYRGAHGPFTAVSQLLLVPLSRTEYDRVKLLVAV